MDATDAAFVALVRQNPVNAALLDRLPALGLRDGFLCAGCLFQAVWNHLSGRPADAGIRDYDVFYCDDRDLSWDAEDAVIRRVAAAFADLDVTIEVRNQARVHLWYRQRFGHDYPRLRTSRAGIDRYLVLSTCVGIEIATGAIHAPHGLERIWQGTLEINPLMPQPDLFRRKAADYRARWPWLTVIDPP